MASRQDTQANELYESHTDFSCDITLSEIDELSHDNARLQQTNESLEQDLYNLTVSFNEQIDALQNRSDTLGERGIEMELMRQEIRVLKSLLQLGWTEEERVKVIQASRDNVVSCLKEISVIQDELEDGLRRSREQTVALTILAIDLGKITTNMPK